MLSLMVGLVHSSATLLVIVRTLLTSVLREAVWTASSLREEDLHKHRPINNTQRCIIFIIIKIIQWYTDLRASVILSIRDTILFTVEPSCG